MRRLPLRHWGLTDFRLVDPAGYYLRITNRDFATEPQAEAHLDISADR
jgi:hypothetical protein